MLTIEDPEITLNGTDVLEISHIYDKTVKEDASLINIFNSDYFK